MLYALGRSDGPLKAKLLGSAVFFIAIAPLSWALDVVGAAIALVLANAVNAAAMMIQLWGEHRPLAQRQVGGNSGRRRYTAMKDACHGPVM